MIRQGDEHHLRHAGREHRHRDLVSLASKCRARRLIGDVAPRQFFPLPRRECRLLKLEGRLTTIKQEREHLRSLIELTEAKKVTTKTIKSLDDLSTVGDEQISSLADQIRGRLDKEDARLEIATKNVAEQIEEAVSGGEIERQLEERRKRLLSGSTPSTGG